MAVNRAELLKNQALGEKLLKAFHDENRNYGGYKITFDQLKAILQARPNQKSFVRNFGGTISVANISESDAIQAMKNLARSSRGRIPARNADFTQAVVDKTTAFSFVDAVTYTAVETTKDVVKGVTEIGNTLITTGKWINAIFPVAALVVLYFVIKKKIA